MPVENRPYATLQEAANVLGPGAEKILAEAHRRGSVTLIGRRPVNRGFSKDKPIPRIIFASAVRFNVTLNAIEADAAAEDFLEFERAHNKAQWEHVQIAWDELRALNESCNGSAETTANAGTNHLHPSSPEAPKRKPGRPQGSGSFAQSDAPLVEKARRLIERDRQSKKQAFNAVAAEAAGPGTPDSKQKRIAKRYSEKYPPGISRDSA